MVCQALDHQSQLVVLGMQLILVTHDRARHPPQDGGIVGQCFGINLHAATMNASFASTPARRSASALMPQHLGRGLLSGQLFLFRGRRGDAVKALS